MFSNVPVMNQINDQIAALMAFSCSLPPIVSQMYAPKNGPAISHSNPKGPSTIPKIGKIQTATNIQIILHIFPRFVHQNFFTPSVGIT